MKNKLLGVALSALSFGVMANVQAAPIDDAWNTLVKDGVFEVQSIAPSSEEEKESYYDFAVNGHVITKIGDGWYGSLSNCTDTYECDFYLSNFDGDLEKNGRVQVIWQDADEQVKSIVDDYVKKLKSKMESPSEGWFKKIFVLSDMALIKGMNISKNGELGSNQAIYYVKELKDLFDNSNITYLLDSRMGSGDDLPFYQEGGGVLSLWYNGVLYFVDSQMEISVRNTDIINIPEDIENTSDAFIAAAKKRIDDYLGKNDIKIELAGNIDDIANDVDTDYITIDKTKMGEYYYKLTINGKTYYYLIMKSSELTTPVVETKDVVTNVSVKTTSPDVPLDAVVKVEEIKDNMPIFKKAYETIKKEIIKAFDISLTSKTVGDIKKLDNGVFEVKIPLGNSFASRKLSAYYLREDGRLEEHPITLDSEGNATFETTHFSEYFIADAGAGSFNEEVPKTFDKADIFIALAGMGVIGLFSSVVFFRTKSN